MAEIAINKIEIGGTYEVCDPVIGRIEPSFIEIIADKGESFLAKDLAEETGREREFSKALVYYSLESY